MLLAHKRGIDSQSSPIPSPSVRHSLRFHIANPQGRYILRKAIGPRISCNAEKCLRIAFPKLTPVNEVELRNCAHYNQYDWFHLVAPFAPWSGQPARWHRQKSLGHATNYLSPRLKSNFCSKLSYIVPSYPFFKRGKATSIWTLFFFICEKPREGLFVADS